MPVDPLLTCVDVAGNYCIYFFVEKKMFRGFLDVTKDSVCQTDILF